MTLSSKLVSGSALLLVAGGTLIYTIGHREPITTSVCELVAHPEQFNGKVVQVKARLEVGYEISFFADDRCEATVLNGWDVPESKEPLQVAYLNSETDLQHPERLKWTTVPVIRPVKVREDQSYMDLQKYAAWGQGYVDNTCSVSRCRKFRVTAIFTGRFDHDDRRLRAYKRPSNGWIVMSTGGFGHLGASSNQLVWQSVSDVTAVPVKRSPR